MNPSLIESDYCQKNFKKESEYCWWKVNIIFRKGPISLHKTGTDYRINDSTDRWCFAKTLLSHAVLTADLVRATDGPEGNGYHLHPGMKSLIFSTQIS